MIKILANERKTRKIQSIKGCERSRLWSLSDGDDDGEILLPARYVPDGCKPDDVLNVFIYLDNEERLIATTLQPLVQVGEFAYHGGGMGQ